MGGLNIPIPAWGSYRRRPDFLGENRGSGAALPPIRRAGHGVCRRRRDEYTSLASSRPPRCCPCACPALGASGPACERGPQWRPTVRRPAFGQPDPRTSCQPIMAARACAEGMARPRSRCSWITKAEASELELRGTTWWSRSPPKCRRLRGATPAFRTRTDPPRSSPRPAKKSAAHLACDLFRRRA